jgi:hypothetical protein
VNKKRKGMKTKKRIKNRIKHVKKYIYLRVNKKRKGMKTKKRIKKQNKACEKM